MTPIDLPTLSVRQAQAIAAAAYSFGMESWELAGGENMLRDYFSSNPLRCERSPVAPEPLADPLQPPTP